MTSPTDREFEQMLQDKGLNAPRITPQMIQDNIVSEHYFTGADGRYGAILNETYVGTELPRDDDGDLEPLELITFCVLVLQNGFTVTGESVCASPENFDAEAERIAARRNAENKIWPLMGYELKCRLAAEPKDHVERMELELRELSGRITKLKAFLDNEKFLSLPEVDQHALRGQCNLMIAYADVLEDRLHRAKAV